MVQRLAIEGISACWWRSGGEALDGIRRQRPGAVICDIRLPDTDGEQLYHEIGRRYGSLPFVFITAYGGIEQAVRLMRSGASDYLVKPFAVDELIDRLQTLIARKSPLGEGELGRSEAMRQIEDLLRRVAHVDSHVLLLGESGVGKEVCARFLHDRSPQRSEPFVAVNCAAIPSELLESELFGYEAGAFTGARGRHLGHVERARRGVLFLDEVSELPLAAQAKLLQLVQNRSFYRLGGDRPLPFEARLLCACNCDLEARVREGKFREDLYYRIHVIPVHVPPLRERPEDILPLLHRYRETFAQRFGVDVEDVSPAAEEAMLAWHWPGNVRELVNRVERAVALAAGPRLEVGDLFPERRDAPEAEPESGILSLSAARQLAERRQIQRALERCEGRILEAARLLGVSRTTLWEKMRRYGLAGV